MLRFFVVSLSRCWCSPHNARALKIAVYTTTHFCGGGGGGDGDLTRVFFWLLASGFWSAESHQKMQHLSACPEERQEGLDGGEGICRGLFGVGERIHEAEGGSH